MVEKSGYKKPGFCIRKKFIFIPFVIMKPNFLTQSIRYIKHSFFALGLVVAIPLSAQGQINPKSIKLFILAGQSNMVGTASNLTDLPPEMRVEQNQVLWYNSNNQWVNLLPPTEPLPSTSNMLNNVGFGPEISLGLAISKSLNETIALVKYAVNGSNLDTDWNPRVANSHYRKMLDRVDRAIASLEAEGYQVKVVGFFWMQGESDAKNNVNYAKNYQQNLINFIEQIRVDFYDPKLPFIYGYISLHNNQETSRGIFQYGDIVRDAQLSVSQITPNTRLIETINLPKADDNLHFNSEGLIKLGEEFSHAWLELYSSIF